MTSSSSLSSFPAPLVTSVSPLSLSLSSLYPLIHSNSSRDHSAPDSLLSLLSSFSRRSLFISFRDCSISSFPDSLLPEFTQLVFLDLSFNRLLSIPQPASLVPLHSLQVLLLHSNRLDNYYELTHLAVLSQLRVLTLFDNPVEHHPSYRHLLVNSCQNLQLLDYYLVSDQELIEGAAESHAFGSKYGQFSTNLEYSLPEFPSHHGPLQLWRSVGMMIKDVEKRHRKFSPVIRIQCWARGVMQRRRLQRLHSAASMIQRQFRRFRAKKLSNKAGNQGDHEYSGESRRPIQASALSVAVIFPDSMSRLRFLEIVRAVEKSTGDCAPPLRQTGIRVIKPVLGPRPGDHASPAHFSVVPHLEFTSLSVKQSSSQPAAPQSSSLSLFSPASARSLPGSLSLFSIRRLSSPVRSVLSSLLSDSFSSPYPMILCFDTPSRPFHSRLLKEIEIFRAPRRNSVVTPHSSSPLSSSRSVSQPSARFHIFPMSSILLLAAATRIQAAWRSYRVRRTLGPALTPARRFHRSVIVIQRWWRSHLGVSGRMKFLRGLINYLASMESPSLILRSSSLESLRRGLVCTPFALRRHWPETRSNWSVDGDKIVSLILPENLKSPRFFPLPRWLFQFLGLPPLEIRRAQQVDGDRAALLYQAVTQGAQVQFIPELEVELKKEQEGTLTADTGADQSAASADGWPSNGFVRLVYPSMGEARLRAALLLVHSLSPTYRRLCPLLSARQFSAILEATRAAESSEALFLFRLKTVPLELQLFRTLFFHAHQAPLQSPAAILKAFQSTPFGVFSHSKFTQIEEKLRLEEEKLTQMQLQMQANEAATGEAGHGYGLLWPGARQSMQREKEVLSQAEKLRLQGFEVPSLLSSSGSALARPAVLASSESARQLAEARLIARAEEFARRVRAQEQKSFHRIKMAEVNERNQVCKMARKREFLASKVDYTVIMEERQEQIRMEVGLRRNEAIRVKEMRRVEEQERIQSVQQTVEREKRVVSNEFRLQQDRLIDQRKEIHDHRQRETLKHELRHGQRTMAIRSTSQHRRLQREIEIQTLEALKLRNSINQRERVKEAQYQLNEAAKRRQQYQEERVRTKQIAAMEEKMARLECLERVKIQEEEYRLEKKSVRENQAKLKQYWRESALKSVGQTIVAGGDMLMDSASQRSNGSGSGSPTRSTKIASVSVSGVAAATATAAPSLQEIRVKLTALNEIEAHLHRQTIQSSP